MSDEGLGAARRNLEYFWEFARNVPDEIAHGDADSGWTPAYLDRFQEALNNDLNTPEALAAALELVGEAYRRNDRRIWRTLRELDSVLGLDFERVRKETRSAKFPAEVEALISDRTAARKARDFKRADELRREIEALGYEVKDNRDGTAIYQPRR
jgi:cysteinyl-tRNA synthetase